MRRRPRVPKAVDSACLKAPSTCPFKNPPRSFIESVNRRSVTELFPTTRWSALIGIASESEPERQRSWSALTAAYWKPAYKHVRVKWKKAPEDAEDLIQSFFARALEKDFFGS